ncbi:MAG: hypothetical protein KDB29_16475, partial [Planctomycetes bacterium]|nr:hypothetical protein [Planctomycetota bacterium]
MNLANRAGSIASIKEMNEQLRAIAPGEAVSDATIENGDLDALRDSISTALVKAQRKSVNTEPQSAEREALRKRLDDLSGAELKDMFGALNLAGERLTASERVNMLLEEPIGEVLKALATLEARGSNESAKAENIKAEQDTSEKLNTSAERVKKSEKTEHVAQEDRAQDELNKVPGAVQDSIGYALTGLRGLRDRLDGVERARGKGHILALEVRDIEPDVARYTAKLDEFRKLAPGNNVDADLVIRALGGEPDLSVYGEPAAADAQPKTDATVKLEGSRRDPTKVSAFTPYEDGDVVKLSDGAEWQVRQDMAGWYLTSTGNWRGTHPTIQRIKAMNNLIREVEKASIPVPSD